MSIADSQESDAQILNWGEDAPRGGKVVLNRAIKENATVSLFFGQTLIRSLRDMGYNSTTSALCEHVDNSIQWGATEVRIYVQQVGKPGHYKTDILVFDNGDGMAPNVLKIATSFGGSMVYGNRQGIGRFGMGMKTAALSIGPVLDIYSWQEPGAIYNMVLDVDAIGRERTNLIELPEPSFTPDLPKEIEDILTRPMSFPASATEQRLLANDDGALPEALGKSGTIIFIPDCDRLSFAKSRTLVEDAVKEMARVYRRFIAQGLRLFVNNRAVEPFDPTYSMEEARHTKIPEVTVKTSRLVVSKSIDVESNKDGSDDEVGEKFPVTVRLYALPIEDWGSLPMKVRRNDLRLYDDHMISFMRNDREVFAGSVSAIAKKHGEMNWLRIQVDFTGDLDEAFGVAANKQGVRPRAHVNLAIAETLESEIASLREKIKRFQGEQSAKRQGARKGAGESKADEAEGLQTKVIGTPAPTTDREKEELDRNLKGLASLLRREKETEEEAFERVKSSMHIITFKHDKYWPFYDVTQQFGKIILTINTAHPFYSELYEPLQEAALEETTIQEEGASRVGDDDALDGSSFNGAQAALVALQLLLLSMARTQTAMSLQDSSRAELFDKFRKEWSETYQTQLSVK